MTCGINILGDDFVKKLNLILLSLVCLLCLTACGSKEKELTGDWNGRDGSPINTLRIKEDGYFTLKFDEDPTDNTLGSVHYTGHLKDGKLVLETREWSYTPYSNPVAKPYEINDILDIEIVSENIIKVDGSTLDKEEDCK